MTSVDSNQSDSLALERQLWVAAREVALENKAEFSVPCSANIKDFIRAGVRNMEREARTQASDLEEAESNLTRLVRGMIDGTPKIESGVGKPTVLREGSLVLAKRLCPLWPFC